MALGLELVYILFFAIIGGVLAVRFNQPSVLGVLIAGALVGPNALGFIENKEIMELSIDIGAILLLFLVGLEFSIKKLFDLGLRAVIISVIKIGIVFFVGYHIALLYGLSAAASIFIGVILSITSTVIFLKILEQKDMLNRPEVHLLIAVLIIEDVFGVFALTFFSSLGSNEQLTPLIIILKLLLSLSLIGIVYFVLLRLAKPTIDWLSSYSTEDTITFMAIGICAGMAYVANLIGLSSAVGAFLAGNIVSTLKNEEAFEKAIHPFILTFTSLFFFSIGTIVDFHSVFSYIWLILLLFIVNILFKFLSVGFSMYLFSDTTGKGAVFSGLAMVSLGEFSLLIAKEANNLNLGVDFLSITAIIIFFSSLSMSLFVTKSNLIYNALSVFMPRGMKQDMQAACQYLRCLSLGTIFTGIRRRNISLEWKHVYTNAIGIFFIALVGIIWYNTSEFRFFKEIFQNAFLKWLTIIVVAIIILFPTFNVIRNFRRLIIDLFKSYISLYPQEIANEKKIFRNIIIAVVLFIVSLSIPAIVTLFGLNPRWSGISIGLIIMVLFIFMKSGYLSDRIINSNRQTFQKYLTMYNNKMRNRRFRP